MYNRSFVVFALVGLVFLGGCNMGGMTKKVKLEETMEAFRRALKRQDQMSLMAFVSPELHPEFYGNAAILESVTVSDAQIRTVFPEEGLNAASMYMEIEYYSPKRMTVTRASRQYSWAYDEELGNWMLKETNPFGNDARAIVPPTAQPKISKPQSTSESVPPVDSPAAAPNNTNP